MCDEPKQTEEIENPEAQELESPVDLVKRLEPLEIERFLRFEAQMKVAIQAVRIVEFELLELKRSLQAKIEERNRQKAMLQNDFTNKVRPQYQAFLDGLAEKYEISETTAMLIDTDLGTIRDSTEV
jgi:hypothetical protein